MVINPIQAPSWFEICHNNMQRAQFPSFMARVHERPVRGKDDARPLNALAPSFLNWMGV